MSAENAWRIAREAAAEWLSALRGRPGQKDADAHDAAVREAQQVLLSLPMPPAFRAEVEAEAEELRGMLAKALPLVEEREFLAETEYSYGSGWPEPSPAEWGISCGYQQTADAMPYQQFEEDVERHHRTNREEDDGDGEFLTLANRIRALLSRLEAKGESHE